MPARDPAATPHHPTLVGSFSSASLLPTSTHDRRLSVGHGQEGPSSGSMGISGSDGMTDNIGARQDGGARRRSFWQTVSGGGLAGSPSLSNRGSREGNGAAGSALRDDDDTESLGSGYARLRIRGEDSNGCPVDLRGEEGHSNPIPHPYISSHAIRDDTARLASLSYTSSTPSIRSGSSDIIVSSEEDHLARQGQPEIHSFAQAGTQLSALTPTFKGSQSQPIGTSPPSPRLLGSIGTSTSINNSSSPNSTPTLTPRPHTTALPSPRADDDKERILSSSSQVGASTSFNTNGPSALSMMLERNSRPSSASNSRMASPHRAHGELGEGLQNEGPSQGRDSPAGSNKGFTEKDDEGVLAVSHSKEQIGEGSDSTTSDTRSLDDSLEIRTENRIKSPLPTPSRAHSPAPLSNPTERTPLIAIRKPTGDVSYTKDPVEERGEESKPNFAQHARTDLFETLNSIKKASAKDVIDAVVMQPLHAIPAVILGLLLNVLDGVSYGMILFPASYVFTDYGSIGVSMFFLSCIISQLTYSLGGSIFKGGNGSMMIEAVPFFHILVNIISGEVGEDNSAAIIATTMASFAFSAILTGIVFAALGAFRLGTLIGYFPRHILVGCIGGIGVFLIETGLEVSRGLKEEGFEYNLATLRIFFADGHAIALWTIPLGLAILLRIITYRFTHQLIFPTYFFIIPVVFYIVVAIGGWDMATLRAAGWVLDVGKSTQPWYKFYTLFDFRHFSWKAFWACIPTQMALVFFGILHVPLNVPALGVSLSEDNVNLDRELVAHGVSNIAAGLFGTVPNYLCYVNTVLFYRVGGGSRLSGLMLAGATAVIMFVGPSVIGFLPLAVVGALIFVLGIDLVKEAVWDTRHRVNRWEYVTIWAITIGMTVFDFVLGLLLGIIMASLFFVVQNSRRKAIRAVFNGSTATSTVRRPHSQRAFIHDVGKQTLVMKLQGFLFFGTIAKVEDEIRKLLDLAAWERNPLRFLIVDFALVSGLDFSSAEAFVRIQRLLAAKDVLLILCGADSKGLVGSALRAVDLWADQEGTSVEVFESLNDALEWTENAYLSAFYAAHSRQHQKAEPREIDFPRISKPPFVLSDSYENSPRRSHLAQAGGSALGPVPSEHVPPVSASPTPNAAFRQPLPTLLQTFSSYTDQSHDFFFQLVPYFLSVFVKEGDLIWTQGDHPDGLFVIESGCLKATYQYEDHSEFIQETMVAGTVAGEMSMLSGTKRNATVHAERDSQLWKLDNEGLQKLERENPAAAKHFIKIAMKVAAEEADVLSSHLVAMLS